VKLNARRRKILLEMYKWMFEAKELGLKNWQFIRWHVLAKRIGAYPNLPKKRLSPNYRLWRLAKRTMYRIVDAGLVQVVPSEMPVKRFGNIFFKLTEEGKEVARRIMIEEEAEGDLEKAVSTIEAEGTIALPHLREELWKIAGWKFKNREEFEKFWNSQKVGALLRKIMKGKKKIEVVRGKRILIYDLAQIPADSTT